MLTKAMLAQRVQTLDDGRIVLSMRMYGMPYVVPSLAHAEEILKFESYQIYGWVFAIFGGANLGVTGFLVGLAGACWAYFRQKKLLKQLPRLDHKLSQKGAIARFHANLPPWFSWAFIVCGAVFLIALGVLLATAASRGHEISSGFLVAAVGFGLLPIAWGYVMLRQRGRG